MYQVEVKQKKNFETQEGEKSFFHDSIIFNCPSRHDVLECLSPVLLYAKDVRITIKEEEEK